MFYLWQGVFGEPHLDELVAAIGHIVLGTIPCGDLGNGQKAKFSFNMVIFRLQQSI